MAESKNEIVENTIENLHETCTHNNIIHDN